MHKNTIEATGSVLSVSNDTEGSYEALVRFPTGSTQVVKIDERFNTDDIQEMLSGKPVRVSFNLSDPEDQGKIVYLIIEEGIEVVT